METRNPEYTAFVEQPSEKAAYTTDVGVPDRRGELRTVRLGETRFYQAFLSRLVCQEVVTSLGHKVLDARYETQACAGRLAAGRCKDV